MKNKLAFVTILACVIALSACTPKGNNDLNTGAQSGSAAQSPAASSAAKSSASPSAFPATSDADVKAIDKYFDDSKSSDFDDKSLDELDR